MNTTVKNIRMKEARLRGVHGLPLTIGLLPPDERQVSVSPCLEEYLHEASTSSVVLDAVIPNVQGGA